MTSPTSSMATSLLTRKPERRGILGHPTEDGRRGQWPFLADGPCGGCKFAVIPRARIAARFVPIGAADCLLENGAIAQLGERFNGIEEVVGSIPSGSTTRHSDINRLSCFFRALP
jgi:hypothetical protein